MHPALKHVGHRPWPLPARPWLHRQSWRDLLFAHWQVPAEALRPLVPAPLVLQEVDGMSWIGVVPFWMSGVSGRGLPNLPGLSSFAELNVRLYVEHDGKPGVWFLSLDAASRPAVWAARRFFHLPYYYARMRVERAADRVVYRSERAGGGARFHAVYGPTSAVQKARPGTLEHFLTERYCLYAEAPSGRLYRGNIHHAPWPLQAAQADIRENTLLAPHGIELPDAPPLLHFSKRLDVVLWLLEPVT